MLTDAHCHPYDLSGVYKEYENERRHHGILIAASACSIEEFTYTEELAHNADKEQAVPILPCFGVHPQIFSQNNSHRCTEETQREKLSGAELINMLYNLAIERRIAAVGECGFDLYNAFFSETESIQEYFFASQIEIAIKHDLPVIIHARRAMHKIFSYVKTLSKCKAVVFHSWPASYEEAVSLLRHDVNAYFSFGNTIMLNHKKAIRSCALLPLERLLTETDAPFQPQRNEKFSHWTDINLILKTAAGYRSEAGNSIDAKDLESRIETNFRKIFK
ncbi:MAG: TatD family hydrolase [Treponema sp.]|nr:TatD family hydrolase [Treponema sp.]